MNSAQLQLLINDSHKRWFQILSGLERTPSLSKNQLSSLIGASSSTIGADIKEIKNHFEQTAIISTSSNGYSLSINNKINYLEKKKKLLEYEPLLTILSGIFYGERISIFEWADRLFLSDRTLLSYSKKLIPILDHYQLKITYEPEFFLKGKEVNIRNFFLALFYEEDTLPHFVLPSTLINNIIDNLSMIEFEYLHLDIPHYRLSYLLHISYQRLSLGYSLKINDNIVNSFLESEFTHAMQELKITFEKNAQIDLPNPDLTYIFLVMLDSLTYDSKLLLSEVPSKNLESIFSPLISDYCDEWDFLHDRPTINYLQSFLYLYYLKNEVSPTCLFFPPSVAYYFQTIYPKELKILKDLLSKHSDGFWSYNSIQFEYNLLLSVLRLSYINQLKRFNIAFIFEGPTEITNLFEELTRLYVPSIHNIYFFHTHTSLESEIQNLSLDLVVTNFIEHTRNLPDSIDYLLFHYIPTPDDWNNLVSYIDPRLSKKYKAILRFDLRM